MGNCIDDVVFCSQRCVVLTSGTLAPLNSFASELGVQFPIRMEAPHCVDVGRQVWAGAVGVGPRGAQLCGTFKVAAEFAYQVRLFWEISYVWAIGLSISCFVYRMTWATR